jgi:hypothetical protein
MFIFIFWCQAVIVYVFKFSQYKSKNHWTPPLEVSESQDNSKVEAI